ncbi:hypothetical protein B0H16DRAFT_1899755, partial [Mycena metata]
MHQYLRLAIESLKNLNIVEWTIQDADLLWAQTVVIETLNTMSSVQCLNLTDAMIKTDHFAALPPLSNLRDLVLSSRNSWSSRGEFLPWLQRGVRASRELKILGLDDSRGPEQLWETLKQENIRLQILNIPEMTEHVLEYLASYSGLLVLQVGIMYDRFGDQFFSDVLPKHVESLLVLRCPGYSEGACSFGPKNITLISEMHQLQVLEMTVTEEDMSRRETPVAGDDIVWQFLEMTTMMPDLEEIAILPAVSNMSARCGNAAKRHIRTVRLRIGDTIDTFAKERGSPKVDNLVAKHFQRVESFGKGR